MSEDTTTITPDFVEKLSSAIAAGIASTAPKKVTAGQYEPHTPWQPGSKRSAHKLKHTVYQNGYRVPVKRLTNQEIDNLNAISRPGRYINRMVEVVMWDEGGLVNLDIRYNNKTHDQRSENKNHWRSFEELTKKIVEEQNVILAKAKRTETAVERILQEQAAIEANEVDPEEFQKLQDDLNPETRVESRASTPKQEATLRKKTEPKRRESFSSASTRAARAAAGEK